MKKIETFSIKEKHININDKGLFKQLLEVFENSTYELNENNKMNLDFEYFDNQNDTFFSFLLNDRTLIIRLLNKSKIDFIQLVGANGDVVFNKIYKIINKSIDKKYDIVFFNFIY